MDVILGPVLKLILTVIDLYIWVVIIAVIMSWLTQFNVVNMSNRFVYTVMSILYRLTEPVLAPIRRILPSLGGLDLSPLVLILGLVLLQDVLTRLAIRFV
jgi:YggT family protein